MPEQEILSDENQQKLKTIMDMYFNFMKALLKKAKKIIITLIFILIKYAILTWIYIDIIYPYSGFEKTVIIAIIGVIMVASGTNSGRTEKNASKH